MYFDYFYKKISEILVRNVFIYMAQFFGEKYMIEHWTKKIFYNVIFNVNEFISLTTLSYKWFFCQIVFISLYSIVIINLISIL